MCLIPQGPALQAMSYDYSLSTKVMMMKKRLLDYWILYLEQCSDRERDKNS